MSRIDDELDRGEEHEQKRIVKTLRGDHYSFHAECWCGDVTDTRDTQAEARREHEAHQREERGW